MPSKRGLGKNGLDVMFEPVKKVVKERQAGENVGELAVKNLIPNPYQPRHTFDEKALEELTQSAAGLVKVPVVIRDYDDATMMEVALVENMQRSDLDPIEEARGIKNMMDALKVTQEEAAKRLGMSRAALANSLRLLKLPEGAAQLVTDKKLTAGQVRPLLSLTDPQQIDKLALRAAEEGWSARMVEEYVTSEKEGLSEKEQAEKLEAQQTAKNGKKAKDKARRSVKESQSIYVKAIQEDLTQYFGTKVKVQPDKKEHGGRIVIEYYNEGDLERVMELLKKEGPALQEEGKPFTV